MGITFFYLKFVHEGCITSISRFPPQQLRVSRSMFDDFCVSIPCLLLVTPHDFPPLLDVWRTRTIRWFPALSSSGMQSVSPLQAALGEKVLGSSRNSVQCAGAGKHLRNRQIFVTKSWHFGCLNWMCLSSGKAITCRHCCGNIQDGAPKIAKLP